MFTTVRFHLPLVSRTSFGYSKLSLGGAVHISLDIAGLDPAFAALKIIMKYIALFARGKQK